MKTKPSAKPAAKKSKPAEAEIKVGSVVMFGGYSELGEGEEPILSDDTAVRIKKIKGDQITVETIMDDEEAEAPLGDTVFREELRAPTEDEQEEIDTLLAQDGDDAEEEEEEEEAPVKKSKTAPPAKGKKAAPVDEDEDEEEEEEEEEDEEQSLGEQADAEYANDEVGPAIKSLNKQAKAAGLNPDDYSTYVELEEAINEASGDEDEEEEEAPAKKKAGAKPAAKGKKPAADDEDAEENEDEEEEEELILTKSVQSCIKKHKNNAIEAASDLITEVARHYFDLGGVLSYIHANNIHATVLDDDGEPKYDESKNGFREFVSQELGFEYKTAYDYMGVYRKFTALGKTSEDFAGVGISKARLLTGDEVDESNVDEILEYAAENTRDDLATYLTDNYGDDEGDAGGKPTKKAGEKIERVKKNFSLFKDQAALLDEALSVAGADIESDDENKALIQIVTEWSENKTDIPLKDAVKAFESRYQCKLEVTPLKKGKKAAPVEEEDEDEDEEEAPPAKKKAVAVPAKKKVVARK